MEEYKICQGIREGRISKPVVCWCIGTCATMFASEVCPVPSPPSRCRLPPWERCPVEVALLPPAGSVWPRGRLRQPGFRDGGGQEPGPARRRRLRPQELRRARRRHQVRRPTRGCVSIHRLLELLDCNSHGVSAGLSNRTVYDELVADGTIVPAQEVPPPTVPMDYSWARVATSTVSSTQHCCTFFPSSCVAALSPKTCSV